MEQESKNYYSMMGLIDDQSLSGIYADNMWHKFNSLQDVLDIMPKNETEVEDKHSIPDVYGRAIQLQISFDYLMKKHAINQKYYLTKEILRWRGILTFLALQRLYHFDISFDTIDYGENIRKLDGKSDRNLGEVFDKALSYPPGASMFLGFHGWDQGLFHIICIKGEKQATKVDMALFSPLTLIYPVADLEKKISVVKGIKWFDYRRKEFRNPVDILSQMEKTIVCFWLDCLNEELMEIAQNATEKAQAMINTVSFHLRQYLDDLQKQVPARAWRGKKCFEVIEIDENFRNVNQTVVDQLLNRTIKLVLYLSDKKKIEYDKIFSQQLYYIPRGQDYFAYCQYAYIHMINRSNWYAFIPFGREVVNLCSRNEIGKLVQNLNMRLIGNATDRDMHVHVRLLLSSILENIDIEKDYYQNKEELKEGRGGVPAIAIWPPEYHAGWKKYYIYLNGGKEGIALDLNGVVKRENTYVACLDHFPNAIALKGENELGVVLPQCRVKDSVDMVNVQAVVGIDYGTSGTTVYARIENSDAPTWINIGENVAQWVIPGDDTEVLMMKEYFISVNQGKKELLSIYHMLTENMKQDIYPLLDGVIFQGEEYEMIKDPSSFLIGIKWNISSNMGYYQAFIEELCLHIRNILYKYGVTNIHWRYALPQGISGTSYYRDIWQKDIKYFLDNAITDVAHVISGKGYTESEAASLYFLHAPEIKAVNVNKGYLIVDIGGGSMDVAVWQQREGVERMLAQTSIAIAGRYLFTQWIALPVNLEPMIAEVFSNDPSKRELINKIKTVDANVVNAILEGLINSEIAKIKKVYDRKPEWAKHLEGQLEIGIALLFFALGSWVAHLKQSQIFNETDDRGNFCIALGGNGSKIMNWLSNKQGLYEMFEKGVESRAIAADYYKPQVILSQNPKKEVAYGLVQDNNERYMANTPAGVEHISNEMALKWNEDFINNYNLLFEKNIRNDKNEIFDIMSKLQKEKDVCNFFMVDMYVNYYMKLMMGEIR